MVNCTLNAVKINAKYFFNGGSILSIALVRIFCSMHLAAITSFDTVEFLSQKKQWQHILCNSYVCAIVLRYRCKMQFKTAR